MEEYKICPMCRSQSKYYTPNGDVTLVQCTKCDFIYANDTDEYIAKSNFHFEDETVERYDRIQSAYDIAWFDRMAGNLTAGKPNGKVLDIGCGNCLLLRSFDKLNWSCSGYDPSPWATKSGEKFGFTIYNEVEKVPLESFDVVVCTSILEHVAQPREHVSFAISRLKKGGVAYWIVPNCSSVTLRFSLAELPPQDAPRHCSFFTPKTLRQLFLEDDISSQLDSIKVHSYGLPELYKYWKKLRLKKSAKPKITKPQQTKKTSYTDRPVKLKHKLAVSFYYWAGRPFHLGDKLEVKVRKAT